MARLKVLVVDSSAGRGATRPMSQALGRQAEVILHGLLADLGALSEVEVTTITVAGPAPGRDMAEPVSSDPGVDVAGDASAHEAAYAATCPPDGATTHVTHVTHDAADRAMEGSKGRAARYATSHAAALAADGTAAVNGTVDDAADNAADNAAIFARAGAARYAGDGAARCAGDGATNYAGDGVARYAADDTAGYASSEAVGLSLERAALQPRASRFGAQFDACIRGADAVWPLAFESARALEHLSREILHARRILLGSAPGAVGVASSKLKLARVLAAGGVATVATYSPHASLPQGGGAWVVKPDDGAGCLHTMLFSDRSAALAWIRANAADGYVLQPFIAGRPGSLSLICCDGAAHVLSCNQERVAMRDNRFHVLGSIVNGLGDDDGALARLAQQVAAAIPSLWGYVGVDFILTAHGAVVLDVNPRLTPAYAGLHASIAHNPAALVLDLLKGSGAMPPPMAGMRRPVSVDIGLP